jgi:predicted nucleic acid-binding protein
MRVFLDASVLVAASERSHPQHLQALPVMRRVVRGEDEGFVAAPSIAETFAALTQLPVQPRIHPSEAGQIVRDNIVRHFRLVTAGKVEHLQALINVQEGGWPGTRIHDALVLACAICCEAERIYTFKPRELQDLCFPGFRSRISAP